MMLTEDEYKTKWCPHTRAIVADSLDAGTYENVQPVHNRVGLKRSGDMGWPKSTLCIGSACSQWRWDQTWESAIEEGVGGDVVRRLKRKQGEPKLGYCGLAGVPE